MDSLPEIIQSLRRTRKIFQLRSFKYTLKLGLSTSDDDKIK